MKVVLLCLTILGLSSGSSIFREHRQEVQLHPVSSSELDSLLQQFIAFIPFERCEAIVDWYLKNNDDVKQAYSFLHSDEFRMLTDKVLGMPEYQDFMKYLYDAGVDIYTYQNIVRKILGLPTLSPPTSDVERAEPSESGIVKMVDDILKVLPLEDIKKWYYNTCLPDPAYQALLVKLNSQEFRDLTVRVLATQEYQDMMSILKDQGIDVDAIEKAIADFFGGSTRDLGNLDDLLQQFAAFIQFAKSEEIMQEYMAEQELTEVLRSQGIDVDASEESLEDFFNDHRPLDRMPRTLKSLLDQFTAFIPTDRVLNILLTYVQQDPDVQEVLAYLQGESFKDLVVKLEGVKELKDFLNWLVSKKIDAYSYINQVLNILGIPEIHPSKFLRFRNPMARSGLTAMIDEIMKVIPVGKIASWFLSTCEPDQEFQELITLLRGDSFKVVVNTVQQDPAFPEMVSGLQKLDVDTTNIGDFLHDYFGW